MNEAKITTMEIHSEWYLNKPQQKILSATVNSAALFFLFPVDFSTWIWYDKCTAKTWR